MPNPILTTITKHRLARHWSEYRLAERSGLPQSTISSWYRKDLTPSLSSLEKVCQAFGITMSQFFGGDSPTIPLTPEQTELLNRFSTLSPDQQQLLMEVVAQIAR